MAESQWPHHVVKRFQTVPPNPRENDFYAPYNKLLHTLFPPDSEFTVAPERYPFSQSHDSIAFEYTIYFGGGPVLLVQMKEPGRIYLPSAREEADKQARFRLLDPTPMCPLRTLRAFSAFGTSILLQGERQLQPTSCYSTGVDKIDVAPIEWWR